MLKAGFLIPLSINELTVKFHASNTKIRKWSGSKIRREETDTLFANEFPQIGSSKKIVGIQMQKPDAFRESQKAECYFHTYHRALPAWWGPST